MADLANPEPISNFKHPESLFIERLGILFDVTGYQNLDSTKSLANCVGGLHEAFLTSVTLG